MPEKVTMYEMFKYVFRTVLRSRTLLFLNIILLLVISGIEFIVPQITRHIIDVVIPSNDLSQLYVAVAVFVGAAIISLVISFTSSYLMSVISQKSITQLRKDLYSYLLELDTEFFESSKTGDLMVRLTSDISNLQNLISPSMLSMLGNFFTFIAVFIYIFILNWQLALAVSFTIPLMFIVYRFFKKRIRAAYKKVKAAESSMSNQIQNMLSQIQLIKSFTNEPIEYQYFSKVADDSQNYTITAQRNHALFTPLIGLIGSLGSAMVLLIGGYFIIQGELTIGEIVAYLSYVAMLQAPIRSLTNLLNQIQQSLISFGRIKEILGQESTIYDSEDAQRFPRLKEGISIRNVSFTYPNKEDEKTMALKNVSFEIPVNQKVALVGRSGSGKTTLTKLLTRMYDVNEGDILFDGVPIK
ncbi:MAG: ABC transporter ATP-binding protein, partial [Erysipelotrichales bacterium]